MKLGVFNKRRMWFYMQTMNLCLCFISTQRQSWIDAEYKQSELSNALQYLPQLKKMSVIEANKNDGIGENDPSQKLESFCNIAPIWICVVSVDISGHCRLTALFSAPINDLLLSNERFSSHDFPSNLSRDDVYNYHEEMCPEDTILIICVLFR